jgi:hypothetical protein
LARGLRERIHSVRIEDWKEKSDVGFVRVEPIRMKKPI